MKLFKRKNKINKRNYRILKKGNRYYPMYRFLWVYFNFATESSAGNTIVLSFDNCDEALNVARLDAGDKDYNIVVHFADVNN